MVQDPETEDNILQEDPPELVADDPEVLIDGSINQKILNPSISMEGTQQAIHRV